MILQLELGVWGDDSVRLAFWDAIHGDDKIFVLNEDSTASKSRWLDDDEQFTEVDLVAELRKMALGQDCSR